MTFRILKIKIKVNFYKLDPETEQPRAYWVPPDIFIYYTQM